MEAEILSGVRTEGAFNRARYLAYPFRFDHINPPFLLDASVQIVPPNPARKGLIIYLQVAKGDTRVLFEETQQQVLDLNSQGPLIDSLMRRAIKIPFIATNDTYIFDLWHAPTNAISLVFKGLSSIQGIIFEGM